jgi:hypothetical protein
MTYVFRARPIIPRHRRLAVVVLIAVALLIAVGARWIWRKLRPRVAVTVTTPPEVGVPITVTRLCARSGCSNVVSSANPRAIYCGGACRTAVHRERRAVA